MERRDVLAVASAAVSFGVAGCLDGGGIGTSTTRSTETSTETTGTTEPTTATEPTSGTEPTTSETGTTRSATGTQAADLGTIEYTVTNEDDEPHDVSVTLADADGTVVQETNEPSLQPDGSVSAGSAGHEPARGPYTLAASTNSSSETYEWDVSACARVDLAIAITAGDVAISEELCQN